MATRARSLTYYEPRRSTVRSCWSAGTTTTSVARTRTRWRPTPECETVASQLSDGSWHGSVTVASDGAQYSGSLAADGATPDGSGVWRLHGDTYRGQLKDGKFHGYGEMRYRSGAVHAGMWVNGVAEGHGRYVDASGVTLHEGNFSKGVPAEYQLMQSVGVLKAAAKFKKLRK